jgi:peroxiredoxin
VAKQRDAAGGERRMELWMSRRSTTLLVLCMSLVIVPASTHAHDASQHGFRMVEFERRTPAPAFTLESLEGGPVSLADYRGRYVLVNFWATWCPPCLEEMPSLETVHQRFAGDSLGVVAISSDVEGASLVRGFIDELAITFQILLDADGRTSADYGAKNLPVTFLLDPQGRVAAAALGARDWGSHEAFSYLDEVVTRP